MSTPNPFYFGYGSNMLKANLVGLKRVEPVNMIPGVLKGYELDFSYTSNGLGTGNITAKEDSEVHGALIEITPDGWEKLKQFEAGYKELRKIITPYKGEPVEASVFIVTQEDAPDRYDKDGQPSANYLEILIKGAEELNVDAIYVDEKLRTVKPAKQRTKLTPEEAETVHSTTYSIDEVKALTDTSEDTPVKVVRGIVVQCSRKLPVPMLDITHVMANRWVHATPENTASPDQYPPELVEYLQVALYDELFHRFGMDILGKLATGHDDFLGYDDYPEHL